MPRAMASLCLWFAGVALAAQAGEWPMYRCDAARSGYTADRLPSPLSVAWSYHSAHAPAPAWPRDDRMQFDRAFDVVVSGGLAIFGSSVDGRVIALNAETGEERWTFFTDAPVRFAPAVWKDRLFVASDDGYLYCLALRDGSLINRWRPGPSDAMILGNGRMVSRWPVRGGPVIVEGIVYFAAGVWQSDGIYILALDAESGRELWRNDDAGRIYMPQPHGTAMAESGVSAQGYLVAGADELLVPTGRAVPASFSRSTGKFGYYHLQANGHVGGTQTVLAGNSFFNGGCAFNLTSGLLETKLGPGSIASMPGGVIHAGKKELRVVRAVEKTSPDRKGNPQTATVHESVWSLDGVDGSAAVVVAENTIVAGGGRAITGVDAVARRVLWTHEVDGTPYGLAVANGRLYVSTDQGSIYCYSGTAPETPLVHRPVRRDFPVEAEFAQAADEIVRRTGARQGYCLDVNCTNAQLAVALAERTELQIYAQCSSTADLDATRRQLVAAGIYGTRVTVHPANGSSRYGKYFADLIVSERSLRDGSFPWSSEDMPAELRPFGGVVCAGKAGAMQTLVRGPLANAGSWTHQYSDLGNTSCSNDELVQGALRALWFRDVDLEMPQRHGRGPAPLFYEGRMFVEGIDALRAVDAYNGRSLWEFPLPGVLAAYSADHLNGTAVTGSNFCVAATGVYVHDKQKCYRLDPATGKKLGEFSPPAIGKQPGRWGYIACDGKRLYGTLANPDHQVRYAFVRADMSDLWGESSALFALDAVTGKLLWRYDARQSIRNNAIAIGSDRVFLIDRPIAAEDKWNPADTSRKLPAVTEVKQPPGDLIALDSATGQTMWKADAEAFGTTLAYSAAHDALLMCYQSTRFKLPSEIGGQLAVYRGTSGERLWHKQAKYVTRPLVNDRTILAQGGSWDLVTGEERPFTLDRSYGCGQLAGSKYMLLFRSATLGYLDLTRGSGVENFGGIRPGCWINALPVGGIVLVPDASAGCQCSYQNRSWMALESSVSRN